MLAGNPGRFLLVPLRSADTHSGTGLEPVPGCVQVNSATVAPAFRWRP
jgi:hypothetical protein